MPYIVARGLWLFFFCLRLTTCFRRISNMNRCILNFLCRDRMCRTSFSTTTLTLSTLRLFTFRIERLSIRIINFTGLYFRFVVVIHFRLITTCLWRVTSIFNCIYGFSFLGNVRQVRIVICILWTEFTGATCTMRRFTNGIITLVMVRSFFRCNVIIRATRNGYSNALRLLSRLFFRFC